jgi:hypothetical protein
MADDVADYAEELTRYLQPLVDAQAETVAFVHSQKYGAPCSTRSTGDEDSISLTSKYWVGSFRTTTRDPGGPSISLLEHLARQDLSLRHGLWTLAEPQLTAGQRISTGVNTHAERPAR